MSFIHENPVLVAPRPVRLTATAHHGIFARSNTVRLLSPPAELPVARSPEIEDSRISTDPSPRSSPRSGLPSEALEEFLSILRPSMSIFPPTSPRRRNTNSLPTFHYERPSFNFKPRPRIESTQKNDNDDLDPNRSMQPSRNALSPPIDFTRTPDIDGLVDDFFPDAEGPPFRWFSSAVLSSPISRMHTRNPFLRQVAAQSPTPLGSLSPAAIPLPTPSPDELLDLP